MPTEDPVHEPKPIDVLGIGNALVDVLSNETDELVSRLGLVKGSMDLIDEARMAELYDAMGPGTELSGGSAANTMVGIASLGGRAHYIGRVRDDAFGSVFAHDLRAAGVGYTAVPAADGPATGCCLILVTPDAERTMNTFLGASSLLAPSDVDESVIAQAKVVFLEGYLFDRPEAQDAFRYAAELAHRHGAQVALTLSDLFCVERHRASFRDLVAGHVDVLFANNDEITSLYEVPDVEAALPHLLDDCELAAVTRSERGALVVHRGEVTSVAGQKVERVVDTTGAGDQFAAGFLAAHVRGLSPEVAAAVGNIAAAEVIGHLGPRPATDLAALAAPLL